MQPCAAVRTSSTEAVFVNEAGHPRDARNLLRAFYPAMRKAGIERFRFHDLRHTFATRLIQAEVDVYTVQKLGRWKTISMVVRSAGIEPATLSLEARGPKFEVFGTSNPELRIARFSHVSRFTRHGLWRGRTSSASC